MKLGNDEKNEALRQAVQDKIIKYSPADRVPGLKKEEPQRSFLTLDEVQALVKAQCESQELKKAFLFACLTGLRWSDINTLIWSTIQHSNEMGHYMQFRQKKTKGVEILPISQQARAMLGQATQAQENVFKELRDNAQWRNKKIAKWVLRAGITKNITFHCARHTYATLQLTMGTDIYTVSKLLGHRELKTTQIYAQVIDRKKKAAANKIQLNL